MGFHVKGSHFVFRYSALAHLQPLDVLWIANNTDTKCTLPKTLANKQRMQNTTSFRMFGISSNRKASKSKNSQYLTV